MQQLQYYLAAATLHWYCATIIIVLVTCHYPCEMWGHQVDPPTSFLHFCKLNELFEWNQFLSVNIMRVYLGLRSIE